MNLFLIGCNLSTEETQKALESFKSMAEIFPTLDPKNSLTYSTDRLVVACMTHATTSITPRQYHSKTSNGFVLYDGCIFDQGSGSIVYKAETLANSWSSSVGSLEGQFVAAKIQFNPVTVELFNDQLGIYPTYWGRCGQGWLVSNSMRLLTSCNGHFALDFQTLSMLIAHGRPMGTSTLQKEIQRLDGGQYWSWQMEMPVPKLHYYFDRSHWSRKKKDRYNGEKITNLGQKMSEPLLQMSKQFGPLEVPLTSGRDTRVMFALVQSTGTNAQFFSVGNKNLIDVKIGSHIAEHFKLPFKIREIDDTQVLENWDSLSNRLMQQTDGANTLAHIANIFNRPESINKLRILLYGAGGEISRRQNINSNFFYRSLSFNALCRHQFEEYEEKEKLLVRKEAIDVSRRYVLQKLRDLRDEGFALKDLLRAHYMFNRLPNFAGPNFKTLQPYFDVYSPFCTATFASAVYEIPLLMQYCDNLHFELISYLFSELHQLPIQHQWNSMSKLKNTVGMLRKDLRKKLSKALNSTTNKQIPKLSKPFTISYNRTLWLPLILKKMRDFCLDSKESVIWEVADRMAFEKICSKDTDLALLGYHQNEIFNVLTIFAYEQSK